MAEIVEYRVDKTQNELKVLVEFGILDEKHAQEIINKRANFEYALRRRTKNKLEFATYIRFEINLLKSIEKYKTAVLKSKFEREEIDRKILTLQVKKLNEITRSRAAHISFLFKKLTTSFQFDKRLWVVYIDFAKERKWNTRVSALYWRLLRIANDDEDLWIAAAHHEIEVRKSEDTASKVILAALRHHPKSERLLTELAKICDVESLKQYRETKE